MKSLRIVLVALTSAISTLQGLASDKDHLIMINGETLSGTIQTLDENNGLILKHSSIEKPLVLNPSSLKTITFAPPKSAPAPQPDRCTLTNLDTITGTFTNFDKKNATFLTPWGTSIDIQISQLSTINLNQNSGFEAFDALSSADNWNLLPNWHLSKLRHTLHSGDPNGIAILKKKLPNNVHLRLDVAWPDRTSPSLNIYLYAPNSATLKNRNFQKKSDQQYMLSLGSQGSFIKLICQQKKKSGQSRRVLEQIRISSKTLANKKIEIDVFFNRNKQAFLIRINQRSILQVRLPNLTLPKGNLLILENDGNSHQDHEITRLEISNWDTKSIPTNWDKNPIPTANTLIEKSGDRYTGKVLKLTGKHPSSQQIHFALNSENNPKTFQVPKEKIDTLTFNPLEENPPPRKQCTLTNGTTLSFTTLSLTKTIATLRHPTFGEITFPKKLLQQIVFHPTPLKK